MDTEKLKNEIITKLRIPYFQNQESYINLWNEIYKIEKDPYIIILMYSKNIGILHHFVYLELCKIFEKIDIQICKYLLEKAIRKNVHDINLIKREYEKYKSVKYTMPEHHIYRAIIPKKLFLWDKEWNEKEDIIISDSYDINGEYFSHLEHIFQNIKPLQTENIVITKTDGNSETLIKKEVNTNNNILNVNHDKLIDHDSDSNKENTFQNWTKTTQCKDIYNNMEIKNVHSTPESSIKNRRSTLNTTKSYLNMTNIIIEDEDHYIKEARRSEIETAKSNFLEMYDDFDENEVSYIQKRKSSIVVDNTKKSKNEIMPQILAIKSYIEIDNYIYYVSDEFNNRIYKINRIAEKNDNHPLTIQSKKYFLKQLELSEKIFLTDKKYLFIPEIILWWNNREKDYILFEDKSYYSLLHILNIFCNEYGIISEDFILYLFYKIYNIINICKNDKIYINCLDFDSFVLDENLEIKLINFEVTYDEIKYDILDKLISYSILKKYKYLYQFNEAEKYTLEKDVELLEIAEIRLKIKELVLEN